MKHEIEGKICMNHFDLFVDRNAERGYPHSMVKNIYKMYK